jgi:hypothetical protein
MQPQVGVGGMARRRKKTSYAEREAERVRLRAVVDELEALQEHNRSAPAAGQPARPSRSP